MTDEHKLSAWRELALRFLDGVNPQPERAIVIADCILSFNLVDLIAEALPLRHHAHAFVQYALRVIEYRTANPLATSNSTLTASEQVEEWIWKWNAAKGVRNDKITPEDPRTRLWEAAKSLSQELEEWVGSYREGQSVPSTCGWVGAANEMEKAAIAFAKTIPKDEPKQTD